MEIKKNGIEYRFTDEMYAKKMDVRKSLGTTLVDNFWSRILTYRSNFTSVLNLSNVSKIKFFVCYTSNLLNKIKDTNEKLRRVSESFYKNVDAKQLALKNNKEKEIINELSLYYKESFSNEFINSLVNEQMNEIQGLSEAKTKTIRYMKTLHSFSNQKYNINLDFLIAIYTSLSNKNISEFIYRNFDFDNKYQQETINREYEGAPFLHIERLMTNFYNFLENKDHKVDPLVLACSSYYFINYVKPFDSYNEEIAVLVFKNILTSFDLGDFINFLPFEMFLNKKEEFYEEFKEVNRGNDMTYVIFKTLDLFNQVIDKFLDDINHIYIEELHQEHDITPQELKEELIGFKENDATIEETKKEETISPTIVATPKIVPTIDKIVKTPNVTKTVMFNIDEKDALKFERYLLEKDPRLKPKQAHFYARHSTIGSYYTIQMFKKRERVVYETARTAMDTLATLGYYKKEQIKNKFVYTPIKLSER